MHWEVIQFTVWSDDENRDFLYRRRRNEEEMEMGPVSDQEDQLKVGLIPNEHELPRMTSEEWSLSFEEQR
jgi:hypothetical protein